MQQEEAMAQKLAALQQAGQLRSLRHMKLRGLHLEYEGQSYLNFSSNDYLGLSSSAYAQYPLAQDAPAGQFLHGNPSSRLMTGNSEEYVLLEEELELLFPGKRALVLGCGFMANAGLPAAIAGRGDVLLADKLMHASFIDGARLSEAELKRFRHNDVGHLERLLQQAPAGASVWVFIESIYSMDGDLAPIKEILQLKEKYKFKLMVDEAHAFGVLGKQGQGRCAQLQCLDQVDVIMCTFGKAIAGAGACILCSELMRSMLINSMRPLIFSTALPPITLMWDRFIINQMRTDSLALQEPDKYPSFAALRAHLAGLIDTFKVESGLPASSQIIPIMAGSNEQSLHLAEQFLAQGYWLTAIRPPTVPQGAARMRLSLTAAFSNKQIVELAQLCRKLG